MPDPGLLGHLVLFIWAVASFIRFEMVCVKYAEPALEKRTRRISIIFPSKALRKLLTASELGEVETYRLRAIVALASLLVWLFIYSNWRAIVSMPKGDWMLFGQYKVF